MKTVEKIGKVAVLMGGLSSEREISLMSGGNVLAALKNRNIECIAVDADKDIIKKLIKLKPNRVFIALHGTSGEDGVIQGVLDTLDIPYPSSGVAASALTMNKWHFNLFCKGLDLPIIPSELLIDEIKKFNFPLCVKPVSSGSSCGVTKVTTLNQLPQAYKDAQEHDSQVMTQPWIEGREFTVGIIGSKALPVIEITTPEETFYDYNAKYLSAETGFICPCDLPVKQQKELQNMALQLFNQTNCRGFARVDFMQDKHGKFYILELNTIPGLTSHSLLPQAAKAIGVEFDDLIYKILTFPLE